MSTAVTPLAEVGDPLPWGDGVPRGLTRSELRIVLAMLEKGLSNRELAARFNTTEQAIKNHLRRIYAKVGVHTRLELASLWANCPLFQIGLLELSGAA